VTTPAPRFRIESPAHLDPEFVRKWKSLADRAVEPNPYLDPRFLLPSLARLDGIDDLRLAIVDDVDEVHAVLAFTVERSSAGDRLSTYGEFMRENFGLLQHPLISSDAPARTWDLLLTGLREAAPAGILHLGMMPTGGILARSFADATMSLGMPFVTVDRGSRAVAAPRSIPDSPNDAESTLAADYRIDGGSSNARKRVRTLQNRLGHELHVIDVTAEPWAIERFLELQASGWKGDPTRGGTIQRHEGWFREVMEEFHHDDRLVVFALVGGDEIVYMDVTFRSGDGLVSFLHAFDERFATLSPGTLGCNAVWRFALRTGRARSFDPNLRPRYVENARLYPDQIEYHAVLLAFGGPWSRAVVRAQPVARRLRSRLRSLTGGLRSVGRRVVGPDGLEPPTSSV
jgi:hypothetical protein